jgi:hypothetical protein
VIYPLKLVQINQLFISYDTASWPGSTEAPV